jgi:hypothetical protein
MRLHFVARRFDCIVVPGGGLEPPQSFPTCGF